MSNPLDEAEVSSGLMVWVDLETTGLDEKTDYVLELGIKVTDTDLNVLRQKDWLIAPPEDWMEKLERTPAVLEMHMGSGLITDIEHDLGIRGPFFWKDPRNEYSNLISFFAYQWLTEGLRLEAGKYPMCGSNVANFDRKFVAEHLPMLNGFFHYRNIDVSTVKELCRIYRPDVFEKLPKPDKKDHRVLADLDWSLTELRYYLDNFLEI